MSSSSSTSPSPPAFWLPRFWWYLWLTELPLTASAIYMWIADPDFYINSLDMPTTKSDPLHYLLLIALSLVTGWAVCLVNGIYLYQMRPSRHSTVSYDYFKEAYGIFQFGMFVGDVFLVFGFAPYNIAKLHPNPLLIGMTIFLSSFFGVARVVFWLKCYVFADGNGDGKAVKGSGRNSRKKD